MLAPEDSSETADSENQRARESGTAVTWMFGHVWPGQLLFQVAVLASSCIRLGKPEVLFAASWVFSVSHVTSRLNSLKHSLLPTRRSRQVKGVLLAVDGLEAPGKPLGMLCSMSTSASYTALRRRN